jgi:branched-chain amino acid transport system ATP-binding protein
MREATGVLISDARPGHERLGDDRGPAPGCRTKTPHSHSSHRSEEQYRRFPILGERRNLLAGTLSGGEQQMLAFARALLMRPRILLLDEPSMGLSPILVERIFDTVQTIHREGATVVLVEQNARLALDTSDYGYVLERGKLVLEGPAADLARDPRVQAAYFGSAR